VKKLKYTQMKTKFLKLIVLALFAVACGSNDDNNQSNTDNEIIEISSTEGTKTNNPSGNLKDNQSVNEEFNVFLENFRSTKLPYKIEPEQELDYKKIPLEYQIKYLSKPEGLDANELKDMEPYAGYYYYSRPISTNKYHAIVYARSEMGSSYYILCTFDNSGKPISFIEFAYYQLMGAGPQAGQEFSMTGTIDETLKITTVSDDETTKYQINDNGMIEKI
jgi:hypothetical protein